MTSTSEELHSNDVFRLGKVVGVSGNKVTVRVDKLKNNSHLLYKGLLVKGPSVGSYVKIAKGFIDLVAKVDSERLIEDRSFSKVYTHPTDAFTRQLEVSFIGYLEGGIFFQGVREVPLLDNECFILTHEELTQVHTFVKKRDQYLRIGALSNDGSQPVDIGVNSIFASHIGIFGNTGSGKSNTLACLYYELFKKFGGNTGFKATSQFVLIDFNGEYVDVISNDGTEKSTHVVTESVYKNQYALSSSEESQVRLPISKGEINRTEFWSVLLEATEKTQTPFIRRALENTYLDDLFTQPNNVPQALCKLVLQETEHKTLDSNPAVVVDFLRDILKYLGNKAPLELESIIDEIHSKLRFHTLHQKYYLSTDTKKIFVDDSGFGEILTFRLSNLVFDAEAFVSELDKIRFKLIFQYHNDVIRRFANRDHLKPLISRLDSTFPRINQLITVQDSHVDYEKPLTVVSLKDVDSDMRKIITILLCKHLYSQRKDGEIKSKNHLNIIIDEAHNILSWSAATEGENWRDYRLAIFEEIIKEGRKFGTFLTIASQRPSDISPTIISQLHNFFLHRLVNEADIRAIEKSVNYLDRLSFESLPVLPAGTCILAGTAIPVPIIVGIQELPQENQPNSRTMSLTEKWLGQGAQA